LLPCLAMNRSERAGLALGATVLGTTLIARTLRAARRLDLNGRTVVITGGSRGLGLVLARQMGLRGARVVVGARDQAELDRAWTDLQGRGIDATAVTCDIGVAEQAQGLIDTAVSKTGQLDVLINNAGTIQVGPIEHMTVEDFAQAMRVHFWGPLHTTLAALPYMRRRRGGRIVNISSIGGKVGVPHLVPYCASKFALTGLSDAMRGELAKDGIYVTTVCPGLMRTGSPFNAGFKGNHTAEFVWFAISDSMPGATVSAERAAEQIIDACRNGRAELVISWPAKAAVVINALVPEAVALLTDVANRLLPGPTLEGDRTLSGWQSRPGWLRGGLITLSDRAAAANNELPAQ
jgi:short-subunit dehydrogenase